MRRALVALLSLVIVAPTVFADLDKWQQKAIDQAVKTLTKSRDPGERREAARTLANFKVPEVVAPLTAALADPDPSVRRLAADSLWRVSEVASPAEEALRQALEDPSPGVRVRAAAALDSLGVDESELVTARVAGLGAELLRDRILAARGLIGFVPAETLVPPVVEVAAAEADTRAMDLGETYLSPVDILERLVRSDDRSYVAPVMTAVKGGNPGRRWLFEGLAELEPKPEGWNDALIAQLASPRVEDRLVGLDLLRDRSTQDAGVEEWIEPATGALDDPATRGAALWALQTAGGYAASAAPAIARVASSDPDPQIRKRAAEAMGEIGDRSQAFPTETLRTVATTGLPAMTKQAVDDPDDDAREAALGTLDMLWVSSDEVLPTYLAVAANDPDPMNRFGALRRIRDLGSDAASAADELAAIAAADPENREIAEQALKAIRDDAPDFDPTITTGGAEGIATGAALAQLRSNGIAFEPHRMWQAINNLEVENVRLLLDAGIDPNERLDDAGMRPLHVLYFGSGCTVMSYPSPDSTTTLTHLFLERGADPNIADDRGNTALKLAASACDAKIVRILIAAGADMAKEDNFGMTAFDLAIGISAFSGSDAPEAFIDAGFRITPENAAKLRENYSDNPRIQEILNRATAN
jgi:HEAT repeat protein